MKKPNYAAMFTLRADGRYQGYWHEEGKNGKKGKRHYIYDRDPERLYNRIQEKESETPPPLTFESAADAWEKKHWQRVGNKTIETYAAPLRRVKDQFSGMNAEEVTAQDIQAFLADLGKQGFARRSVQMQLHCIDPGHVRRAGESGTPGRAAPAGKSMGSCLAMQTPWSDSQ